LDPLLIVLLKLKMFRQKVGGRKKKGPRRLPRYPSLALLFLP